MIPFCNNCGNECQPNFIEFTFDITIGGKKHEYNGTTCCFCSIKCMLEYLNKLFEVQP